MKCPKCSSDFALKRWDTGQEYYRCSKCGYAFFAHQQQRIKELEAEIETLAGALREIRHRSRCYQCKELVPSPNRIHTPSECNTLIAQVALKKIGRE